LTRFLNAECLPKKRLLKDIAEQPQEIAEQPQEIAPAKGY